MARPVDVAALVEGIREGRRADVSRAITLVESSRAEHRADARELLTELAAFDLPQAVRVGISGVPGVGKSTFIEALGTRLTAAGHRVGVLAVDPSSIRTGGSVLGDKTRMAALAVDPRAFIRPSPVGGHPRRRRTGHDAGDARARGGRPRRRPGRDRRGRAVRGHRRRDGRHLPLPHPRPHRRPAPGDQEGHPRDRRRGRGQQGRRRLRGRCPRRRARAGRCTATGARALRVGTSRSSPAPRSPARASTTSGSASATTAHTSAPTVSHTSARSSSSSSPGRSCATSSPSGCRSSAGVAAVRDDVRRAVLAGELPAPLAADRLLAAYDGDTA